MKKVYLKTPEAVIKALKEGKIIKTTKTKRALKMVDGVIVQLEENGFVLSIGSGLTIEDKPYIEEQEHLKLEVGKWYETRDHQNARCYKCVRNVFFFTIDNVGNFSTLINGNYNINGVTSNLDIIGPWEEDK